MLAYPKRKEQGQHDSAQHNYCGNSSVGRKHFLQLMQRTH